MNRRNFGIIILVTHFHLGQQQRGTKSFRSRSCCATDKSPSGVGDSELNGWW